MNKETLENIKGDLERSQLKLKQIQDELEQSSDTNLQKTVNKSDQIINTTRENNSSNRLLLSNQEAKAGLHRESVGGMWEEIGKLQLDFIFTQKLKPEMKFVDIGCGCLRGGVHFLRYLNSGNYYGIDMRASLIDGGYQ